MAPLRLLLLPGMRVALDAIAADPRPAAAAGGEAGGGGRLSLELRRIERSLALYFKKKTAESSI